MNLTYAQIMSIVYTLIIVVDIVLEQMHYIPAGTGQLILAGLGLHASGLMLPSVAASSSDKAVSPTPSNSGSGSDTVAQKSVVDNWTGSTSSNG